MARATYPAYEWARCSSRWWWSPDACLHHAACDLVTWPTEELILNCLGKTRFHNDHVPHRDVKVINEVEFSSLTVCTSEWHLPPATSLQHTAIPMNSGLPPNQSLQGTTSLHDSPSHPYRTIYKINRQVLLGSPKVILFYCRHTTHMSPRVTSSHGIIR